MKKHNLKTLVLGTAVLSLLIVSCKKADKNNDTNNNSTSITPTNYTNLDDFFVNNEQMTQEFSVNVNSPLIITGEKGTKIEIPHSSFIDQAGNPVYGNVDIELIEVLSPIDMILSGKPTTSAGGNVLESGGEFYLSVSQNGKELSLAPNAEYTVELPAENPVDGMTVWGGNQVDDSTFVWDSIPPSQDLDTIPYIDSLTQDTIWVSEWDTVNWVYVPPFNPDHYLLDCNTLKWINCDKWWNYTTVQLSVCGDDSKMSSKDTKVYIIYPSINSVDVIWGSGQSCRTRSVPLNTDMIIVAIHLDGDGVMHIAKKDANVTVESQVDLEFDEVNEDDLIDYLKTL